MSIYTITTITEDFWDGRKVMTEISNTIEEAQKIMRKQFDVFCDGDDTDFAKDVNNGYELKAHSTIDFAEFEANIKEHTIELK